MSQPTKREQKIAAYKALFDLTNPQALTVLDDLCKVSGVLDGGFVADASMRDFAAGKRHLVCEILTIIGIKHTVPFLAGVHDRLNPARQQEQIDNPPNL